MLSIYTVGVLSLLQGAAYAVPATVPPYVTQSKAVTQSSSSSSTSSSLNTTGSSPQKLQLQPISAISNGVPTVGRWNVAPKKSVNLAWQTPNNDSIVSVGVTMQNSAVVLEDVEDISAVDCTGNSTVAVTFNNTEAFNEALSAWSALNDSFVMITNHLGDCDSELERSFFVADSDTLASYADNMTIVAQAEKSDLVSTASTTEINFSSNTASTSVEERGINWDDDGMTIAYNYSLPSDQTIVDTDYVTIKLNEVTISNSVTYSGHAKWELFEGVTEFYLDVDKSVYHYADMDMTLKIDETQSWTWAPTALTYSLIDIPGIISFGPSAGISFGGSIDANVATTMSGVFTASMPSGSMHIDLIDWSSSYSDDWTMDHTATVNLTEDASVTLTPSIDFTVEFACSLFGGLLDLSTGVKAEPSFPFTSMVAVTEGFNSTSGAVTYPNSTSSFSCANGVSETVDFKFDVIAFASKWVDVTLYEYKTDIWSTCLNFFSRRK